MTRDRAQLLGLYGIAVICGLAVWLSFAYIPAFAGLELWLADIRRLKLGAPSTPSSAVVVLAVGEKTLAHLPYRSPLDRNVLAELIDSLNEKGARAIALDLFLDQPTEASRDERLLAALRRSRAPVTVAWLPDEAAAGVMTVSQQQWFAQFRDAGGFAAGDVSLSGMDSYGVVRWLRVPADGLRPLSVVVAESLGATVAPGLHRIEYLLPDARGTSPFPVYEILPPLVRQFPPAEWVSGKIVLIGAVRPFEDRHLTPLNALSRSNGDRLPGVLIHANAIEQWLAPRPIVPAPPYDALLLAVALACLAVPLVFGQVAVWKRALASVSGLCLLEFTSLALYRHRVVELPLLAPPVAFAVAAGLLSAHLSRQYSRQRRFLRETFGHYLAPAVIDHLIDHPEAVRLGGEVRDVTCLFTDIEEFTALAETLPPERLTELMNNYLEGAVDILFAHQGTLDKFVGDAIVAFFGAPGEQHDHAERAVRCALALDRYAREFASQQHAQGVPLGRTRIGVHSGMVVVGNFGSIRHFNYTVLGDTVNTAARLEGANKHLGTTIAISESSAVRCGDVARRPAAKLMLKGKSEAVAVWEPLQSDAVELMYLVEYGEFIERLERGEVEAARALLQRLRGIAPGDPLLQLHWRRIEAGEASLEMSLDSK